MHPPVLYIKVRNMDVFAMKGIFHDRTRYIRLPCKGSSYGFARNVAKFEPCAHSNRNVGTFVRLRQTHSNHHSCNMWIYESMSFYFHWTVSDWRIIMMFVDIEWNIPFGCFYAQILFCSERTSSWNFPGLLLKLCSVSNKFQPRRGPGTIFLFPKRPASAFNQQKSLP